LFLRFPHLRLLGNKHVISLTLALSHLGEGTEEGSSYFCLLIFDFLKVTFGQRRLVQKRVRPR
jgi:hypothetical protein